MKKFLSLVLAMIMTMSLVTISAGATEYKDLTDKSEIQYEEAVAVLNRIGVITGYDDGTFRPETELTRGAAAKIIVSLMIGPDSANALPNTSSPYSDVPASHTFAGVISYCKTAGYISGYSDGTFKPAGTLTGYAFAKMLLGALGYKSDVEGFTGYGWTNNVARIGSLAQLFDRISFDGAAAVTRDQACQLALNTLKATMVEYSKSTVSGPTGSYTVEGQAQPRTSNNRDINANIGRKDWYGGNNKGSDYLTLEFGEEHFKDLRLEHDRFDPAHDQFGRPSNEWSYKKVTIGTFPLEADFTYTTQVAHIEETDGAKEKALGLRNYDLIADGGYSIWNGWGNTGTVTAINGGTTTLWLNGLEDRDYFDAVDNSGKYTHKVANIADFTDNGTLVEVYVSDIDADWITDVVVIQTQLMEVKKVGSDYVSLERYDSPDAAKNASPRGTANIGFNLAPIEVNVEQVKDNNEDCYNILKGMKASDYVAVVPVTTDDGKTYEAAEVYVPETVSGALTRVDTYGIGTDAEKKRGAVSITVGGTAYKLADWNDEMWSLKTEDIKATRKDVTLVMDKYGNAFLAKDVGATNDFMVIGNFYQALAGNKICTFVHGWDISGNEVDLNLGSSMKVVTHGGTQSVDNHVLGELVYYTSDGANGDADYVLRHVSADGSKLVRDVYTNLERTNNNNKVEDAKADYEIKASNLLLPVVTTLTDAEIKAGEKDTDNRFGESVADYGRTNTQADGNGLATHDTTYADTNYIDRYYDKGVKFIYVNYVSGDDEVESVEFKSGVQNVSQDELRQAIMSWPSQAAVKDDQVKAVVIKRESNDANINRMLYVTKTLGFKEYDSSTNESFYEVEVAMFTSDGKFVTEQHIVVNKDLQIGDFATYTKVAGTKYEDNYYRVKEFTRHNTNPAALRVEKVSTVMSTIDNKMVKHLMELGANETYNLYNGAKLIGDIGDDGSDAEMYKESYVLGGYRGSSTTVPNTVEKANGIIRTDKAEWLNATRNSIWDDIDSVEDLFDRIINYGRTTDIDVTKSKQTLDNVTLKILLNEKPDSDGFRSAYLIVIADVDSVSTPTINDPLNTGHALNVAYTTTWDRTMVKGDKFSVTVLPGYKLDLANVKGAIMVDHNVDESYWTFEKTSGTVIIPLIKIDTPVPGTYTATLMVDGVKYDEKTGLKSGDTWVFEYTVPEGKVATVVESGNKYTAGEVIEVTVTIGDADVTAHITLADAQDPGPGPENKVTYNVTGIDGVTAEFKNENGETIATVTGSGTVELPKDAVVEMVLSDEDANFADIRDANGGRYAPIFKVAEGLTITVAKKGASALINLIYTDGTYPTPWFNPSIEETSANALVASLEVFAAPTRLEAGKTYKFNFTGIGEVTFKCEAYSAGGTTILRLIAVGTDEATMGKLNDALAKPEGAEYTDFEEVKDPVTPVEPSETIKAELDAAGTTAEFYSYWGEATKGTALTAAEVKAALETATGHKIVGEVDLSKNKVTLDNGVEVTYGINSAAGSYKNPKQLFKVTVNGASQYLPAAAGSKFTGLDAAKVPAVLEKKIVAAAVNISDLKKAITVGEDGVLTLPALSEDIEFVTAVKYVGEDAETPAAPSGIKVYANSVDAGKPAPVELTFGSSYVQAGASLMIINSGTAQPNVSFVLEINGEKSTQTFDSNGQFNKNFTFTNPTKYAGVLEVKCTSGFAVYMNGVAVAGAENVAADKQIPVGDATGVTAKLAYIDPDDGKTLAEATSAYENLGGKFYYTVDAAHAKDGKIDLWEVYSVTTASSETVFNAADNADMKNPMDITTGETKLFKANSDLYLTIPGGTGKILTLAANSLLKLTPVKVPTSEAAGVWKVSLVDNITAASFGTALDFTSKAAAFAAGESFIGAAEGDPVEVKVEISPLDAKVTADSKATVEFYPPVDGIEVTKAECEAGKIVVTLNSEVVPSEGTNVGTFRVVLDLEGDGVNDVMFTADLPIVRNTLTIAGPTSWTVADGSAAVSGAQVAVGEKKSVTFVSNTPGAFDWSEKTLDYTISAPSDKDALTASGAVVNLIKGENGTAQVDPDESYTVQTIDAQHTAADELAALKAALGDAGAGEVLMKDTGSGWAVVSGKTIDTLEEGDLTQNHKWGFGSAATAATMTVEVTMGTKAITMTAVSIN